MVLSPSLSQCLLFKFSFSCHEKRYIKWNTRREIIHLEASCLRLDYFLCGVCVSWFLFNTASNCCCHAMLLFLSLQNFQVLFLLLLFASNGFFSSVFCFVVWCVYLFHLLPFFPFWERQRQTNHFRNLKKERNSIKEPDSLHCYIDRWTYSTKELNRKTHLIFSFFLMPFYSIWTLWFRGKPTIFYSWQSLSFWSHRMFQLRIIEISKNIDSAPIIATLWLQNVILDAFYFYSLFSHSLKHF